MNQPPETLRESKIHGNVEFPCAFYTSLCQEIQVQHHWHEEIELVYMEGPSVSLEVNTKEISIPKPAFYFVNQEQIHALRLSASSREYAMVFRLDMLSFSSYDLAQQRLLQPLVSHQLLFPSCVLLDTPSGREMARILLPLLKKTPEYSPAFLLQVKASLLSVLGILDSAGLFLVQKEGDRRDSQKISTIKLLLSHIQTHYSRRIYLKELSSLAGMDEQYFCRFFKKALGKTPVEYINAYRIERACEFLRNTDEKILNICYDCGFQNMGHFINCFKAQKNMTPSAYRSFRGPEVSE